MTPPDPLDGCWTACGRSYNTYSFPHTEFKKGCTPCIRASMLAYGKKVAREIERHLLKAPSNNLVTAEWVRRRYGLDEEWK